MNKNWLRMGLIALVAAVFVSRGYGDEASFKLAAMGGCAVSPDNTTLVVSLPAKTELVFIDTVAGKETRRVTVEFQPTQMVWSDKTLFVAQKGAGVVHILDAESGKEVAKANVGGPVRNLILAKGVCFASTGNREVAGIDEKGKVTKATAQGTFIATDGKGENIYTCIDGRATTDVVKFKVDGAKLLETGASFRSLRSSLINVQGMGVSADGKQFGVVAGGGWTDQDRKRHYSVPFYDTEDMKSQVGEMETTPYPSGMTAHPALPLMFACNGKEGSVFSAKSYAPGQKIKAPREAAGASAPSVLAFVGKGQKLAWGVSNADSGELKIYDLELTKEQQEELKKAFASK
jgi:hypothetical protein